MLSQTNITELLIAWGEGDHNAPEILMPLVEKELHRIANRYMRRENRSHTLQTTALVNEAYIQLVGQRNTRWQNRAHFFGIAAGIMRRILLNYARDRSREKRGGHLTRVSLSEVAVMSEDKSEELIALDEALRKLESIDERKSRVVELRYFGGLSVEETAVFLKSTPRTVARDWKLARAWLRREIERNA
ncbi:MAG TPA: sigma-70 family RNA polymerase sigma factor [Pyrinomonadaceae bacterium]